MTGKRLSVLQWETFSQQISRTVNNLPIGLGNKTKMLESLDILSPNQQILERNNSRSPTTPLVVTHDVKRITESNKKIYEKWFQDWLVSYVRKLVKQPKWFLSDKSIAVGDVVLFLKPEETIRPSIPIWDCGNNKQRQRRAHQVCGRRVPIAGKTPKGEWDVASENWW